MKRIVCILSLLASVLLSAQAAEKPVASALKRVLLITGRDVPAHNWRETAPLLREQLEQTKLFEVVVCEEPLVLESSALSGYDVILLDYYNWQRPGISEKA